MDVVLQGENIIKDYQMGEVTVHALKGVSLSIHERELIVILGPSGSGKSTMMNILGGIEAPTSGKLLYGGEELHWEKRSELTRYRRQHIGFVFQFYNLLPGLTALENIRLASALSSSPMDAEQLLREVGLWERGDHFPSRLSGGEQQRIAIARALCKNPDLLLCDEPTGALDSATGIQVLRLIHRFSREYGKPVVLITHNADIARIADRVLYFKDGRMERSVENPAPVHPDQLEW